MPEVLSSPAKRKNGRPTVRTPQNAQIICDRLVNGDSLVDICKTPGLPDYSTVVRWIQDDESFRKKYACARELQGDWSFENTWELAKRATPENHAAIRIQVDTLKWRSAKLRPKVYGDQPISTNVQVNVAVISAEKQAELMERRRKLLEE